MRTVTFRSVRDSVCFLMGVDPEELQANLAASITDALNRAVRRGWEIDAWWPWTIEEVRRWRQSWDVGTTYAAGVEVWHDGSERYYRAVVLNSGVTPGTNNAIWEEVSPEASLSFTEPTMTEIGRLVGCFTENGIAVDYVLLGDRAFLVGNFPDPVRVQFAQVRPVFSSREWDGAAPYPAGRVVLRGDDCFLALAASQGADPVTNPAVWRKQEMPDVLADFAAQDAYATMLEIDMQTERAIVARAQAKQLLEEELDKVFLQQQQTRRFRVIQ